jgi:CheY-like chemotaxis protein
MVSSKMTNGELQAFRAPYRFLVVDDNRDAADSMRLVLQLLGGHVRTAYDGLAALDVAEKFLPHAVILDIGLPKLDGLRAARLIREQEWGKGMVLLAVSGWCRDEDRQHSIEAGFDGHLPKPVHVEQIRNLLQELLDAAAPLSA